MNSSYQRINLILGFILVVQVVTASQNLTDFFGQNETSQTKEKVEKKILEERGNFSDDPVSNTGSFGNFTTLSPSIENCYRAPRK